MIVKEFMPIVPERLKEYTEAEVAVQGGLKVVPTCGPKTLKMTQDIESISVGSKADMSFNIFRSSATASKSDDIRISINTFIIDCESGKKLVTFSYQNKGQDLIVILKELAKWNVQYLYDCQY
jgi:hypothetical protein